MLKVYYIGRKKYRYKKKIDRKKEEEDEKKRII